MGARQLPLKVGVKREQFRQETRPDLDEVGGLHAPPSCVASSSAYLVRNRAADSGKGGKAFSFLPNTTHSSYLTATGKKQPGLFITRGPAVISLECAARLR